MGRDWLVVVLCITASVVTADDGTATKTPRELDTEAVFSPTFSFDGKLLAIGGSPVIEIWDVQGGKLLRTLSGHKDACRCVDFAPDGQQLVAGDNQGAVKFWDVQSGREQASLSVEVAVDALQVSPDGETVAVALFDHTVVLIDMKIQEIRDRLTGHTGRINDLAFSSDSKRLASAGDIQDKTVRVWDTDAGRQLVEFSDHDSEVSGVDFSPDGKNLVSVGNDGLRLWDAETLRPERKGSALTRRNCMLTTLRFRLTAI